MVDSGASMHMLSRKDLNSAEVDTVFLPRNPTRVITANGEVPTNEEATVCVFDLDLFVTVQILEDTPAVLSLRELCEDHGYSLEWISGQKNHTLLKMAENPMQHWKLRTDRCPRIINRFFQFDCKYISYIVNAGPHRRLFAKSSNKYDVEVPVVHYWGTICEILQKSKT